MRPHALAKHYLVIVMDSRGHGRSTRDKQDYSYHLMASDVIGLMDFLKIKKAAIVGWSDGAILGLDMAINHPERITKLFAFAPNSSPDGISTAISNSLVNTIYMARAKSEYEKLSSTPTQYQTLFDQLSKMWATQPNFTKDQLGTIKTPIWIVDGDHDEAIKRSDIEFIAFSIPGAGLLIQPGVGHFALLQDSKQFNDSVAHFLEQR